MEAQYLRVLDPAAPSYSEPIVFGPLEVEAAQAVGFKPLLTNVPSGSPINALIDTDVQPRKPVGTVTHWRFEFSNGQSSGGVGFTTPDKFGPGWAVRAIYQVACGNLAGRGALCSGWAKAHGNPSFVDWYMERTSERVLTIYSVVNGEVQSTPAVVTFREAATIDNLRPIVLFDVPASGEVPTAVCTVRIYRQVPIDADQVVSYRKPVANASVVDTWLFDGPEYAGAKLIVAPDGRLTIKVANIMKSAIQLQNVDQRSGTVVSGSSGLASTMMMPLGDLARVESLIRNVWAQNPGSTWTLESDARLVMGGQSFTRANAPPAAQVSAEEQDLV